MKRESELQLARIKSEIFEEQLRIETARDQENKAGIVHRSECFDQIPPWKKKTPKEHVDEIIKEYNSEYPCYL